MFMKNKINFSGKLLIAAAFLSLVGCTRDIDTEVLATYPDISEVFMDDFTSDLQFQAWGKVTNFSISTETKYEGTSSMQIEIPKPSDPMGSWAGGTFYSLMGRNLSNYDALTFYAKSSIPTTIEVGLGNYEDAQYLVTVKNIEVNTNWSKVIIPIPNAAKLLSEQGLFYYSAGAVNGEGYTLWFDNVQFEKLGTLAHARIEEQIVPGFPGELQLGTLTEYINLPNGVDCKMEVSSNYFTFESSDSNIASVEDGKIIIKKSGKATIAPKEAQGTIRINSFDLAPAPQISKENVISLFSDAYTNEITANWNPRWQWSTAEFEEINAGGQHVAQYSGLNFVGIVFDETADCSEMTHMHLDLFCLDKVDDATAISISIYYGTDEVKTVVSKANFAEFESEKWLSIDIPLILPNKQIPQLALACDNNTRNVLLDNMYFYKK